MTTPRFLARLTALGAFVALGTLTSCSTFDDAHVAARVGDFVITDDQVTAVAQSPAAGGPLTSPTLDGDLARQIITVWARGAALAGADFLDQIDVAEVRAGLIDQLGDVFTSSDPFTQQLVIDNTIISKAIEDGVVTEVDALAQVSQATVEVDPRYGTWDPIALEVVALGS